MKVKLSTSMGAIVMELDEAKAPISAENFRKYVDVRPLRRHDLPPRDRRLHDPGRRLHQGHDARSRSQAPIKNESTNGLKNELRHDRHGAHQRARLGHVAVLHQREEQRLPQLRRRVATPDYAVFGKVTEGQDVVDKIGKVATGNSGMHQDVPTMAVVIEKAELV